MSRSVAEEAPEVLAIDGLHPLYSSHVVDRSQEPSKGPGQEKLVQDHTKESPRRRKWWALLVIVVVLAIGAIVGGTVGGIEANRKKANVVNTVTTTITTYPVTGTDRQSMTQTASSASSGSTGTSEVTTDCPSSNGTTYEPGDVAGGSGIYTFIKYCGLAVAPGRDFAEAFVPSFNDCIDMCSNYNYDNSPNTTCFSVTFKVSGIPPGNCWIGGSDYKLISNTDFAAAVREQ